MYTLLIVNKLMRKILNGSIESFMQEHSRNRLTLCVRSSVWRMRVRHVWICAPHFVPIVFYEPNLDLRRCKRWHLSCGPDETYLVFPDYLLGIVTCLPCQRYKMNTLRYNPFARNVCTRKKLCDNTSLPLEKMLDCHFYSSAAATVDCLFLVFISLLIVGSCLNCGSKIGTGVHNA